jgi:molybdopterin-guanine dinucleotide biosynthesis protein
MRIFIALAFALTACASSGGANRPINVAAVRHEINDTIHADKNDRDVTAMGRVRADNAVVYTTSKTGVRQEETWVKAGGAWKLDKAVSMSSNP